MTVSNCFEESSGLAFSKVIISYIYRTQP